MRFENVRHPSDRSASASNGQRSSGERTATTRPPTASIASRARGSMSESTNPTERRPARAAYAAKEIARASSPTVPIVVSRSSICDTARAANRSRQLPVGFARSSLRNSRRNPISAPSACEAISGVSPSPSVTSRSRGTGIWAAYRARPRPESLPGFTPTMRAYTGATLDGAPSDEHDGHPAGIETTG